MMHNDTTMTIHNKMSANTYACLSNQGQVYDEAYYRNIRSHLLQQSAQYLGADLSDSKVLSMCFGEVVHNQGIAN
jgi:hypothetical protein